MTLQIELRRKGRHPKEHKNLIVLRLFLKELQCRLRNLICNLLLYFINKLL